MCVCVCVCVCDLCYKYIWYLVFDRDAGRTRTRLCAMNRIHSLHTDDGEASQLRQEIAARVHLAEIPNILVTQQVGRNTKKNKKKYKIYL